MSIVAIIAAIIILLLLGIAVGLFWGIIYMTTFVNFLRHGACCVGLGVFVL